MIELPAKRASRFHTIRQPRGAEPRAHGLGLASVIEQSDSARRI